MEFADRRKRDKFYWYLNDVLVECSSALRTFSQWRKDNPEPDATIEEWAKGTEVALYLDVRKIEEGWRRYCISPDPANTLEEVSSHRYVLSFFKKDSPVVVDEDVVTRFAIAITTVLPRQKRTPLDVSKLPNWLRLDQVSELVWDCTGKEYSKEAIRKFPFDKHTKTRGLRSKASVLDYCRDFNRYEES